MAHRVFAGAYRVASRRPEFSGDPRPNRARSCMARDSSGRRSFLEARPGIAGKDSYAPPGADPRGARPLSAPKGAVHRDGSKKQGQVSFDPLHSLCAAVVLTRKGASRRLRRFHPCRLRASSAVGRYGARKKQTTTPRTNPACGGLCRRQKNEKNRGRLNAI